MSTNKEFVYENCLCYIVEEMKTYKCVRGMRDIFGQEIEKLQIIEKRAFDVLETFGYEEIRTPIVENSGLFERSVGDMTDIVSKEMYTFLDKKERKLSLRPEGTASVVRAYVQNHIFDIHKITRLYYYGPMFRYDRPQKGRYRQFHQLGVELFGGDHPLFDGEVIELLSVILKKTQVSDFVFHINSIGCGKCKQDFLKALNEYITPYSEKLCCHCQERLKKNPMRILDCKSNECQQLIKEGPAVINYVCNDCRIHLEKVTKRLEDLAIPYKQDSYLVRGLDYYTKTVFEVFLTENGNAIAAGGRYDSLVEQLGGPPTPATGFAIGMERLFESSSISKTSIPRIHAVFLGENARSFGVDFLQPVREKGLKIITDFEERPLKTHLKMANRESADWCIIIGDNEVAGSTAMLKNMHTGLQETVEIDELINKLTEEKG